MTEIKEIVYEALVKMIKLNKSLSGTGLLRRISKLTNLTELSVKQALGDLVDDAKITGVTKRGEVVGKVYLTNPPEVQIHESQITWEVVLRAAGLTDREVVALSSCYQYAKEFNETEQRRLINGLIAIREKIVNLKGQPRFVVSAQHLLGSSKLLGSLDRKALNAFGIDVMLFPDSPPQFVVAGPESPKSVLLIENPHSFEQAIAAGIADQIALIVTYGYGLSMNNDSYGASLVSSILDSQRAITLRRLGNTPDIKTLLKHPRIAFWGDLDSEGVRIYNRLKASIPQLELSDLYLSMLKALCKGDGHPYVKIVAKDGQRHTSSIPESLADHESFIRTSAIDQEMVTIEDIAMFAGVTKAWNIHEA